MFVHIPTVYLCTVFDLLIRPFSQVPLQSLSFARLALC